MQPDPAQVRQPASPSDQRLQRQATLPVPLQLGHLGKWVGPIMGLWSISDFTSAAPANTLRPVASWVNTIGPIFDSIRFLNSTNRVLLVTDDEFDEK